MEERRIQVTAGEVTMMAVLNGSGTADLVWDALPIQSSGQTWGDEIYFRTTIEAPKENSSEVVEVGDVAYWPPGKALCLFFGPTPASRGDEILPASAVNVVGRLEGDAKALKRVPSGALVVIERAG